MRGSRQCSPEMHFNRTDLYITLRNAFLYYIRLPGIPLNRNAKRRVSKVTCHQGPHTRSGSGHFYFLYGIQQSENGFAFFSSCAFHSRIRFSCEKVQKFDRRSDTKRVGFPFKIILLAHNIIICILVVVLCRIFTLS